MSIPAAFTIATAKESQTIDAETVQSFGIDEFTLMEVAGISAAKEILSREESSSHGVFLCGKGNNGGDALVVARYLAQHGIETTVVFIGGDKNLSSCAQKNYGLLKTIAKEDSDISIKFYKSWSSFDDSITPDFIIDGMLGTGLDSDLRGDYPQAVKWANDIAAPIYAMDIPTGLHTDTGQVMGAAIFATQTFAFGVLKQGYYLGEGHRHTGTTTFCELPFPHYLKRSASSFLIDNNWLPAASTSKPSHKYEAGVVYIIAGSEGLTGAAILAAKSAWAEGIGAVILICPRGLLSVFENNLPQIIKKPVGSKDDCCFGENHLEEIIQIVQGKPGTMLIGPGLGRNESTVTFAHRFLTKQTGNIVVDADALWALSQQDNWQKPESANWILTPHPGELSTLWGTDFADDMKRLQKVQEAATSYNITLLSKGFPAILGTPDGNTYLTGYDTRVFSRAGFGDILAGKITAFWSKGQNPDISCCRALLNGYNKITLLDSDQPEPLDLI